MTCVTHDARSDLLFTMSDNLRSLVPIGARQMRIVVLDEPSRLVEPDGIEPTTSCLQSRRSPN
jgi:hypothetical protein